MKDIQTIKQRLAAIQNNFNPQKNTYKVIEYVVNNDLTYSQMLMELSKIKGFSKYPEELKNEYVSIINDIKENIIKQRKEKERERQEANTKELKDIIANLEKSRKAYMEKQNEITDKTISEEKKEEPKKEIKEVKKETQVIEEPNNSKEEKTIETDEEKEAKIKKILTMGIAIVIILIVIVLFAY